MLAILACSRHVITKVSIALVQQPQLGRGPAAHNVALGKILHGARDANRPRPGRQPIATYSAASINVGSPVSALKRCMAISAAPSSSMPRAAM